MRAKWLKFSILPSIKVRVGGQCIAPKTRTTLILDRCMQYFTNHRMKKIILIFLLLFLNQNAFSQETESLNQELPTEYGVFTIPLWTKLTIELKETSKDKFEYRIISSETYDEMYSFEKREKVFSENPIENTIDILFVGAYYNEGKEDKDYKTLLKIRNNLKVPVMYKADIKYYFKEEFENTSIVGAFPGTDTQEIWVHKIDLIALYDFEVLKTK